MRVNTCFRLNCSNLSVDNVIFGQNVRVTSNSEFGKTNIFSSRTCLYTKSNDIFLGFGLHVLDAFKNVFFIVAFSICINFSSFQMTRSTCLSPCDYDSLPNVRTHFITYLDNSRANYHIRCGLEFHAWKRCAT